MGRTGVALIAAALAFGVLGCSAQGMSRGTSTSSLNKNAAQHAPAAAARIGTLTATRPMRRAVRGAARVTKLLVVVEENHSLREMEHHMPFTFGLARRFSYATDYTAATHPSLPNYLAIAGGSTYGIADDNGPANHSVRGRSVFGQALSARKSATVYVAGMPHNCATADGGHGYVVKTNPWAYFGQERSECQKYDVPLARFAASVTAGTLPNAGLLIPNLCNDAHSCSLATADSWLRSRMGEVFAGPDWRAGRLAVVVTGDEDDHSQGNNVLTLVVHPSQHGNVVTSPLTHYSLSALFSQVIGTAPLHEARAAPSMARAFHLPLAARTAAR
jgi:phosphatidylinositol-3-phosphatase